MIEKENRIKEKQNKIEKDVKYIFYKPQSVEQHIYTIDQHFGKRVRKKKAEKIETFIKSKL